MKKKIKLCPEGELMLRAAILERAEQDFLKSLIKSETLDNAEKAKEAADNAEALRKWFCSDWGQLLSDNNGDMIIQRIEQEASKKINIKTRKENRT